MLEQPVCVEVLNFGSFSQAPLRNTSLLGGLFLGEVSIGNCSQILFTQGYRSLPLTVSTDGLPNPYKVSRISQNLELGVFEVRSRGGSGRWWWEAAAALGISAEISVSPVLVVLQTSACTARSAGSRAQETQKV